MRYRFLRALSAFSNKALSVVVRAFLTTLVFGVGVVAVLHYFGMPIPNASQVWEGIERLSRMARFS
ncbi:MAG TPA: hypothetical protein VLE19_00975 [Pyrinomonadaceae bacterium]|nr:hypothetical protein [Pyrinomonadaceae bacterium]